MARVDGDPRTVADPLGSAVQRLDPDLALAQLLTLDEVIGQFYVAIEVFNVILTGFGVLALLLAAVGVYGVLAHFVNQRTHEIGVRIALGAESGSVLGLVLRRGLALVAAGLLLGIAVASTITRFMQSLLYGVAATDLATFIVVSTTLALVAAAACVIPALKAVRIDPLAALRTE